jgi:hypothetical protein
MATELDKELLSKANEKKEEFSRDMIMYKNLYLEDETNDYPFFLYLASIMNFIEHHNGGCLTEWGMKSLQLDISPYIQQIQRAETKLSQKDLVRFLLNLLNSYAVSSLVNCMIAFYKEDPVKFLELNDFPKGIVADFDKIEEKTTEVISKLKKVLDCYSTLLEGKYKRIFTEEKTKGFYKPIFDPNALKISSGMPNGLPAGLENAREVK